MTRGQLLHNGGFLVPRIVLRVGENIRPELRDIDIRRNIPHRGITEECPHIYIFNRGQLLGDPIADVFRIRDLVRLCGRGILAARIELGEHTGVGPKRRGVLQSGAKALRERDIGKIIRPD
jgi:hypothetical protein